ncbi:MAG: Crp/Fnr family transcriptional regulator [Spirochaetia bacterium]|nr:Crp/Fnr family transcriptional regulator [Spirochaetia bacterium]
MNLDEKKLLRYFRGIGAIHQQSILDFAQHLYEKHPNRENISDPVEILRPEEESVVSAIKRLRKSYPMLDSMGLLGKSSELLTQNLIQGKEKKSTIDELEVLFKDEYTRFAKDNTNQDTEH